MSHRNNVVLPVICCTDVVRPHTFVHAEHGFLYSQRSVLHLSTIQSTRERKSHHTHTHTHTHSHTHVHTHTCTHTHTHTHSLSLRACVRLHFVCRFQLFEVCCFSSAFLFFFSLIFVACAYVGTNEYEIAYCDGSSVEFALCSDSACSSCSSYSYPVRSLIALSLSHIFVVSFFRFFPSLRIQ